MNYSLTFWNNFFDIRDEKVEGKISRNIKWMCIKFKLFGMQKIFRHAIHVFRNDVNALLFLLSSFNYLEKFSWNSLKIKKECSFMLGIKMSYLCRNLFCLIYCSSTDVIWEMEEYICFWIFSIKRRNEDTFSSITGNTWYIYIDK